MVTELRLIQKTLERIEIGNYGVCTWCGVSIPMTHLEIVTCINLYVKCAEIRE